MSRSSYFDGETLRDSETAQPIPPAPLRPGSLRLVEAQGRGRPCWSPLNMRNVLDQLEQNGITWVSFDSNSRAGRGLPCGPAAKGRGWRTAASCRLSPRLLFWITGFVLSAALHGALVCAFNWRG